MVEKRTAYAAQTVVYRRKEDGGILILAMYKKSEEMYWQSPRGGIEKDESPEEAALREMREETGIEKPLRFIDLEYTYRFEYTKTDPVTGSKQIVTVVENCFAAETDKTDIVLSDEHSDFRWLTPEEALKVVAHEDNKETIRRLLAILDENGEKE